MGGVFLEDDNWGVPGRMGGQNREENSLFLCVGPI
jgi:hypothetical protein